MQTFSDIYSVLGGYSAGDKVTLTLCRAPENEKSDYELIDVEITLAPDYG